MALVKEHSEGYNALGYPNTTFLMITFFHVGVLKLFSCVGEYCYTMNSVRNAISPQKYTPHEIKHPEAITEKSMFQKYVFLWLPWCNKVCSHTPFIFKTLVSFCVEETNRLSPLHWYCTRSFGCQSSTEGSGFNPNH